MGLQCPRAIRNQSGSPPRGEGAASRPQPLLPWAQRGEGLGLTESGILQAQGTLDRRKVGALCTVPLGDVHPAALVAPAARNLGNCHGTWDIVPFVNCPFQWGVVITTFLSFSIMCLAIVPKLRKMNAVLITPQPIPLTLRRLQHAETIPLVYSRTLDRVQLRVAPTLHHDATVVVLPPTAPQPRPTPRRGRPPLPVPPLFTPHSWSCGSTSKGKWRTLRRLSTVVCWSSTNSNMPNLRNWRQCSRRAVGTS